MEPIVVAFFVPVVVFLVIVAPIWLVLHYRAKGRAAGSLTQVERADVEDLIQAANKMAGRIETLEAILDVETPGWRDKRPEA
jgi:phage shock protein B